MLPVTTLGRAANAMIDTNCLETPVTRVEDKHQHRRTWLHSSILDSCNFQECLKSLTNNKAPDPDGIVNELLKAILLEYQQTIHKLLIVMWATGITQRIGKPVKLF